MPTCTQETIKEVLGLGYELPGVECKGAASIDDRWMVAHVLRAMAGMSNLQDGGIVVLGIAERAGAFVGEGLAGEMLESWSQEALAAKTAPYFDPALRFHVHRIETDGVTYVAIEVGEFELQPTLVKRELQAVEAGTGRNKCVLREGGCYVRSAAHRETREIPTAEDMRLLLERAIQKGVNRWVQQARASGLIPPAGVAQGTAVAGDVDRFRTELEDL